MRLPRQRRRQTPETIVSLIDVVFFLLVFFLLVGRYDANAPFDVAPPVASVGEPLPSGGRTVSVAADGRLALDGTETEAAALVETLAEAAAGGPIFVRLNAHAEAPLRHVLPLISELGARGVGDVALVVTPPKEGR